MKKIFCSLALASLLVACGGNGNQEKPATKTGTEDKPETPANDLSGNPVYQKGLALIGASDCLTCHKIDEVLTGPSYTDVAEKYKGADEETITKLAQRIIKGGNGVWGETFMTPHATLSEADAKAMVNYILLLKK